MGTYLLKAHDSDLDRWKAAAEQHGFTFAAYIRAALDAFGAVPTTQAELQVDSQPRDTAARTLPREAKPDFGPKLG